MKLLALINNHSMRALPTNSPSGTATISSRSAFWSSTKPLSSIPRQARPGYYIASDGRGMSSLVFITCVLSLICLTPLRRIPVISAAFKVKSGGSRLFGWDHAAAIVIDLLGQHRLAIFHVNACSLRLYSVVPQV